MQECSTSRVSPAVLSNNQLTRKIFSRESIYVNRIIFSRESIFLDGPPFRVVCLAPMSELSTKQVAERLGVTRQQVGTWCRRGLLAGAYEQDTPRGSVWMIPATALEGFTPPKPTGRPPKPKAEGEAKPKRAQKAKSKAR